MRFNKQFHKPQVTQLQRNLGNRRHRIYLLSKIISPAAGFAVRALAVEASAVTALAILTSAVSALAVIAITVIAQPATAAVSITGATGLMVVPTAHLIPDKKAAFGIGYIDRDHSLYSSEYAQIAYYVTAGYLPFLETTFRITVFPGMPFSGNYGSDKDRMVSLKLRVMEEGSYLPSIVLGGSDVYGESVRFNSLYVVMSRSVRFLIDRDLYMHLGYASDLMEAQHHSMVGIFGGLEMSISRYLTIMGEYDTRRFNAGLRVMPWDDRANMDLIFMGLRGLSGGMSLAFNL